MKKRRWAQNTLVSWALGTLAACGSTPPGNGGDGGSETQTVVVNVEQIPVNNILGVATGRDLKLTIAGEEVPTLALKAGQVTDRYGARFAAERTGAVAIHAEVKMEGDCAAWMKGDASVALPGKVRGQVEVTVKLAQDASADLESCNKECAPGSSFCWPKPMVRGSHLNAVQVISAKEAWAVGDRGQVVHFQGSDDNGEDLRKPEKWSFDFAAEKLALGYDLTGVWGSSAKDVWVVGHDKRGQFGQDQRPEGLVLHYDGAKWETKGIAGFLKGVWGSDSTAWAVGSQTCTLTLDNAGQIQARCALSPFGFLYAIHGNRADNRWAAGAGFAVHWKDNGTPEKISYQGNAAEPSNIWVASDSDIRVVGQGGLSQRCDATACAPVNTLATTIHAAGMWGLGSDVWYVSWPGNRLVHWGSAGLAQVGMVGGDAGGLQWSLSGLPRANGTALLVAAGLEGTIAVASVRPPKDLQSPFQRVLGSEGLVDSLSGVKGQTWLGMRLPIYDPNKPGEIGTQYVTFRAEGSPAGKRSKDYDGVTMRELWVNPAGTFIYGVGLNTDRIFRRSTDPAGKWESYFQNTLPGYLYDRVTGTQVNGKTVIVASGSFLDGVTRKGLYTTLIEGESNSAKDSTTSQRVLCVGARDGNVILVQEDSATSSSVFRFPAREPPKEFNIQTRIGAAGPYDCHVAMLSSTDAWIFEWTGDTYRVNSQLASQVTMHPGFDSKYSFAMRPAPFNDLWVLGRNGRLACRGLSDREGDPWRTVEMGTLDDSIAVIWGDDTGTIWLGGGGGTLLRLRKDRLACPPPR